MLSVENIDNPNKRICKGKTIVVENHVWIGNDVVVLKGVNIGHDSVIGTKSVVSKDVPNNVIAVRNPARVVKEGVNWNKNWLRDE